jgi:hypothetical protein
MYFGCQDTKFHQKLTDYYLQVYQIFSHLKLTYFKKLSPLQSNVDFERIIKDTAIILIHKFKWEMAREELL